MNSHARFYSFFYVLETVYLRCQQAGFGIAGRLALEPGPASCSVLPDSGSPPLKWGWWYDSDKGRLGIEGVEHVVERPGNSVHPLGARFTRHGAWKAGPCRFAVWRRSPPAPDRTAGAGGSVADGAPCPALRMGEPVLRVRGTAFLELAGPVRTGLGAQSDRLDRAGGGHLQRSRAWGGMKTRHWALVYPDQAKPFWPRSAHPAPGPPSSFPDVC